MKYPEVLKAEYRRLSVHITALERAIDSLPEGSLIWRKKDNVYRYYWYKDGARTYLSKDKQELIEGLAKKKYLNKMLIQARQEKKAISKYLKCHSDEDHAQELLERNPNIENILKPLFIGMDERLKRWEEEEYHSTAEHPEHLIHPGPKGKMYRSKSEASIATVLHRHRIPFRYEWDKDINGVTYHIDFTIRHPKTGQIIYWEHCGGMDKDGYSANIGTKIREYAAAGIFPDRNLILTFESRAFPFESWMAEEIVARWFLQED